MSILAKVRMTWFGGKSSEITSSGIGRAAKLKDECTSHLLSTHWAVRPRLVIAGVPCSSSIPATNSPYLATKKLLYFSTAPVSNERDPCLLPSSQSLVLSLVGRSAKNRIVCFDMKMGENVNSLNIRDRCQQGTLQQLLRRAGHTVGVDSEW